MGWTQRNIWAGLAMVAGVMVAQVAVACGGLEDACATASGSFHVVTPATIEGASEATRPAVIFLHGWQGRASGTIRNRVLTKPFLDKGYVFAAANGSRSDGSTVGGGWSFREGGRRNDVAFLADVKAALVADHGVDPDRVILAGFSLGGSMVSYAACAAPEAFAGYAPVAGGFWNPLPEVCDGPVRLFHTHGWSDKTFPLEGRVVGNGFTQGDTFAGLNLWRRTNGCDGLRADRFEIGADRWVRRWERCRPGSALEFVLHTGGHGLPSGWAASVMDWVDRMPPLER